MISRVLKEIEIMAKGHGLKGEYEEIKIKGVSTDSRRIKSGQLFVPIVGENFNGHQFISDAIEKGAAGAIWCESEPIPDMDFPFILVKDTLTSIQELAKAYRNQLDTKVIGITGSNGKTSTKDILASILKTKYKTHKTFANLNNHLGVPLTILELEEDTEMAVVEMGMDHLGDIELLTSIASPDVAVITNIGEAHLDYLITKTNIVKAKLEILKGLNPNGLFVYFGDDPLLSNTIKNMDTNYKTVTFGENLTNTYIPEIISIEENGTYFKLDRLDCPTFFLSMVGKHQVYNATAAITVARYFGISLEQIQEGLSKIEITGMRNELIYTEKYTILNDSYKSNPTSLLSALETLYSFKNYKQKIAVLGDMNGLGIEEVNMHMDIGMKIEPDKIDYLITIGSLAVNIAKAAKSKFPNNRVFSFTNKALLVEKLKEIIQYKSMVLIKGSRELKLEDIVKALISENPLEKEVI
ncbi:MAG: UDP-N-acetylmuramoyl-tripeptide--D-alanyl-D-alanine ligase [Gottschalkiaceae bacterium]|nr:MAG: UDP-N-acetylmuramoyl-tripeptide--D-alanyl-D-alanine ligase [Gottschalkiaceae bacterium]